MLINLLYGTSAFVCMIRPVWRMYTVFSYRSVMRMVVISSMSDTGLAFIWWMTFDGVIASLALWSKCLPDSNTVVVGTDSMTVVGTRFLPSWWCWWWLFLFCTKLPLRFERVDAADALLLFRREPEYVELNFVSRFEIMYLFLFVFLICIYSIYAYCICKRFTVLFFLKLSSILMNAHTTQKLNI